MTNHLDCKGFDSARYRSAYPDVSLSGLEPHVHYQRYGRVMGRDPSPGLEAPQEPQSLTASDLVATPALLDLHYARGILPQTAPIRHPELVSIVMPSYNNEEWLARALNSALSQQGVAVEVILVDDGSTDGSVGLAHEIGKGAPNLKVISLLRNFGCYYARNIGLLQSKGRYLAILDTDDIIPPDRIARQLDTLKNAPNALASRCLQRRWRDDFTVPLSELKYGESSLVWRREVIDRIGLFDAVRYSGDAEFRFRIQRSYGAGAVTGTPDELYYARMKPGSMTANKEDGVFTYDAGKLSVSITPPRKAYEKNFSEWQKNNGPDLHISFPLFSRPFELGDRKQNASPSLRQKRIGTMASFPERRETLEAVLTRVLPQLDELKLYLNDYEEIPECARDTKIRVTLSKNAEGDLRDNGKFFDLPDDNSSYIFTFDDDILYPVDYVSRLIHYIELFGRANIVGVHGANFPADDFSRLEQRTVFAFQNKCSGRFVDLLGTGTTAWHSSALRPTLNDFKSKGVCDLWFAILAAKGGIPLFAVPRADGWLKELKTYDFSLFRETNSRPTPYFTVYQDYVRPALQQGRIRRETEAHLSLCYDRDTLQAAGIDLPADVGRRSSAVVSTRRSVQYSSPLCTDTLPAFRSVATEGIHFHIIVNGWNCKKYVANCLQSIAQQHPASYSFAVTLVDDQSDDGTFADLLRTSILPQAQVIRVTENTGPAHARHLAIKQIEEPDTIIVLLDMDDALEPHALSTVAERYRANPQCLLTIGNWHDQYGKKNPQSFYTRNEIDNQNVREIELFNATHLRTFRRRLYDAVEVSDLLDREGKWLETCTDVAIMYPLLDQCYFNQVEFIDEPIYRYTRQHGAGTLARFGKPHKVDRLNWLKAKSPKPRLNTRSEFS